MLPTEVTKNVIAPRRQARKERLLLIAPNLGALCAFARVTGFSISFVRNPARKFQISLASVIWRIIQETGDF
jgi:hypothetical protein